MNIATRASIFSRSTLSLSPTQLVPETASCTKKHSDNMLYDRFSLSRLNISFLETELWQHHFE